MGKFVLSIDRGTTQIKVCLVNEKGNIVDDISKPSPKGNSPETGWYEQDMNEIYQITAGAVKDLLNRGHDSADIEAVGVTGQGNGIFLLDDRSNPVRPAIMPIDLRCGSLSEKYEKNGIAEQIRRLNFFGLPSCSPLAFLLWIRENEPEVYGRIRWVISCKDWIRFRLTGTIGTDKTDASGAGLMDLKSGKYSQEIFEIVGAKEVLKWLPEIHESCEIAGYVSGCSAKETGLKAGTPVVYGAHDIAACALGAGGKKAGDMTLAAGTFGICLGVLDQPMRVGAYSTTLCHILPDKWLSHYSIRSFGHSLKWFLELLCHREQREAMEKKCSLYEVLDNVLESKNPTDILVRPYLYGSMNGEDTGSILGLKSWHDYTDVILGVYQGFAYAYVEEIRRYQSIIGCGRLSLCGGGAKSRTLGRILADASGMPVYVSENQEETCKGAGLCAWLGVDYTMGLKLIQNAAVNDFVWTPHIEAYRQHEENLKKLLDINSEIWGRQG